MRVLHLYKDYYPVIGGIENHVRLLARGQARRGHDVTVLVTHPGEGWDDTVLEGVRLIRAKRMMTAASTPLSLDLFARVARQAVDVTHLHFPYPVGEVAHLLLGRSKRTVITYHSDVVRQRMLLRFYRPLLWRVLRRTDRIIATSPQYIESSPYLRTLRHKCDVVPLGITLDHFDTVPDGLIQSVRGRFPGRIVLFVGRLRYYKGLNYLIDAMRDVEATLLVVGTGPMEAEWRHYAETRSWSRRIVFSGSVPDEELPVYYQACDVFVLPASERSEAFGAVQIEAMAAGKPVVSTELGTGTSYVNRDGETGFVVPPRDSGSLAAAVKRLLDDEDLRRRMGEAGRHRARTEFTEDIMVERVMRVYESLHG